MVPCAIVTGVYKAVREFDASGVDPTALLAAVWDVGAYPEFVKGVREVRILRDDGNRLLAEFTAGVAGMDFTYVLSCERDAEAVRWRRLRGAFRAAEGSMVHLGGGRFRYENAMDPGFAVPEFAVRFILERSLPRLIREFLARAGQAAAEEAS